MGTMESCETIGNYLDDQKVSLENFSKMTGFPLSYIKKELLLDEKAEVPLSDLRKSMMLFLQSTITEMEKR